MPLALLAPLSLAAFAAGILLIGWLPWPPAAAEHLILAVGVLPLILAAMGYFTPVLTRGGPAPGRLALVPLLGLLGGVGVFLALLLWPPRFHAAALPALAAAGWLAVWMWQRGRAGLGAPHPGLAWYLAALACLVLALLAILATALWPAQWLALKRLHLHLNLLGFVGLTAVGTLRVLLPTARGRPDPQAAARLRGDLPYAVGGTLLVAVGAAWLPPLAVGGALLWLVPLVRFIPGLDRTLLREGGAALLLAIALAGYTVQMALGVLHGMGGPGMDRAVGLFFCWFLFPLVLGASTQLLPVWWAGPVAGRQAVVRRALASGSPARALLLLAAGALWSVGSRWGLALAAGALAWQLGRVVWVRLRTASKAV